MECWYLVVKNIIQIFKKAKKKKQDKPMASDLVFVCARKQKKISWSTREGQRLEQALMNFLTVPNEIQNRMNEYILKKWTEWNKKKKASGIGSAFRLVYMNVLFMVFEVG